MDHQVMLLHRTILEACEVLQELRHTAGPGVRSVAAAEASCVALSMAVDQCADCPEVEELAADAHELTRELRALLVRTPDTALARAS